MKIRQRIMKQMVVSYSNGTTKVIEEESDLEQAIRQGTVTPSNPLFSEVEEKKLADRKGKHDCQ